MNLLAQTPSTTPIPVYIEGFAGSGGFVAGAMLFLMSALVVVGLVLIIRGR